MSFNLLLIVVAILFGLYEVIYGFYAYRLNGFAFYAVAGLVIGAPFLLMGLILIVHPDQSLGGGELLLLPLWAFGVGWKASANALPDGRSPSSGRSGSRS